MASLLIFLIIALIINFIILALLSSATHKSSIIGVLVTFLAAVVSVHLFELLGIEAYFLYFTGFIIVLSLYSWGKVVGPNPEEAKKMNRAAILSNITFIVTFAIYFLIRYNSIL